MSPETEGNHNVLVGVSTVSWPIQLLLNYVLFGAGWAPLCIVKRSGECILSCCYQRCSHTQGLAAILLDREMLTMFETMLLLARRV